MWFEKYLRFVVSARFSILDGIGIAVTSVLLTDGHYASAGVAAAIFAVGALIDRKVA